MPRKIYQFQAITDLALNNNALLWVVGEPSNGLLYKPTILQMKKLILGNLVDNSIILSDGTGLTNSTDFTFNPDTGQLLLDNGGFKIGSNPGGQVNIIEPINAGYVKAIVIDQPNMKISLLNGNGDSGGSIQRPTQNSGEFRITAGATIDGALNPVDGYLTFICNATEVFRMTLTGAMGRRLTTVQRDALTGMLEGMFIYNLDDNEYQFWDSVGWSSMGGGGGTPVIDYTFQNLTDAATVVLPYGTKQNFRVTIGGNRGLNITGAIEGKPIYLKVTQDGTGNRTITFPANSVFPMGMATGTVPNTTTTGGATDAFSIIYDGTDFNVFPAFNLTNI